MAIIKYAENVPAIPAKWSAYLSGLLDKIGISSITISSTFRSADAQANAMYYNALNSGTDNAKKLYQASGQKVIDVMIANQNAKKSPADTISAMTAKVKELGGVSRHNFPATDKFVVMDIPPWSVPESKRQAFENLMSKEASKFISPYVYKGEPVYHIEFGGVKASTVAIASGSAMFIIAGIGALLYIISRR
jgi:hypothetical protein